MTHTLRSIRRFAHAHDDTPVFHATYFILTALAAVLFNLGMFVMLVLIHMGLDIVKYREVHGLSWHRTIRAMLRESLIDIALVCLGLAFAVYLHHSLPSVAALSGLALAEITLIHAAGLIGPKFKILCDVLGVFLHLEHYMAIRHPRLAKPFTGLETVCIATIAVTLFLIMTSTLVLDIDYNSLAEIILHEMVPGLA